MDVLLLIIGIYFLYRNKIAVVFAILIGLFTNYYQFGSNLSTFLFPHNVNDTGIILFFFLFLKGYLNGTKYKYPFFYSLKPLFHAFTIFLIISILYDFFKRNDILSIIQTSRHWLIMILAIPLLSYYPVSVYKQTVKYILYITIFVSIVILSDFYLGTNFMNKELSNFISNNSTVYTRAAIPSTYTSFYILLLFTNYFRSIKSYTRYILIFILLLTTITSMIRSLFISEIIGIIIILYRTRGAKRPKLVYAILGCLFFVVVINKSNGFRDRLSMGIEEVTNYIKPNKEENIEGNFTFRMYLLKERAEYVSKSIDRAILGIGNIKEENFSTTFKIGLYDDNRGRVGQLNTGDIAWALLILRLGFVGSFLFILIWLKCIVILKNNKSNMAISVNSFFIILFLLSFSSSDIANGFYWFFLFMLIICSYYDTNEFRKKNS